MGKMFLRIQAIEADDFRDLSAQEASGNFCEYPNELNGTIIPADDIPNNILTMLEAYAEREREISNRMFDMKYTDEKTGEHPNATTNDYRKWAEEEWLSNVDPEKYTEVLDIIIKHLNK